MCESRKDAGGWGNARKKQNVYVRQVLGVRCIPQAELHLMRELTLCILNFTAAVHEYIIKKDLSFECSLSSQGRAALEEKQDEEVTIRGYAICMPCGINRCLV